MTKAHKTVLYKRLIWLYLILLIFEGALRKWVIPSASTPLLIVRDPIVIYMVLVGLQNNWIKNAYGKIMMTTGCLTFILTMLIGHQNLFVAFFGARIWFFHFPFIFVIQKVLNREDIIKMGKFLLVVSIFMTILVMLQLYTPQSSIFNRSVGGGEGTGFMGGGGLFRPEGTFSFNQGFSQFQGLILGFLLYFLLEIKTIEKKINFKKKYVYIIMVAYLMAMPMSISRTVWFTTFFVCCFVIFVMSLSGSLSSVKKIVKYVIIIGCLFPILLTIPQVKTAMDGFVERFDSAAEVEGNAAQVLEKRGAWGVLNAFTVDAPFFGYGTGYGTNVGAQALRGKVGFTITESELPRCVGESGILLGGIIVLIRLMFPLWLIFKTIKYYRRTNDILPVCLVLFSAMMVTSGQWGVPTALGFGIFSSGATLASMNTSKITLKDNNERIKY